MDSKQIISKIDHTSLKQTAPWPDIQELVSAGKRYQTASVCIAPMYVKEAVRVAAGYVDVCTVIGFPNGYQTTKIKVLEAEQAILDGAKEIDMVINLAWLKDRQLTAIKEEIDAIKEVCGDKVLKVIIETSLLTEEEKIVMCNILNETKADFIKTSTGFAGGGATVADIKLLREHCAPRIRVKASGGIKTIEDAVALLEAGADRLGTSTLLSELLQLEEE